MSSVGINLRAPDIENLDATDLHEEEFPTGERRKFNEDPVEMVIFLCVSKMALFPIKSRVSYPLFPKNIHQDELKNWVILGQI